jgi:hypothetical protein
MTAAGRERGWAAARALRERGVVGAAGGAVDVEGLAVSLGARVVRGGLEGAQARLVRHGARAIIRLSERVTDRGAQRFSVAHELGHLVLGHSGAVLARVEDARRGAGVGGDRGVEAEADGFAAELLMPADVVAARVASGRPGLELVEAIQAELDVSLLAAALRMVELATVPCAVVLSRNGRVGWAAVSRGFGARIERSRTIDPRSMAARCAVSAGGRVKDAVPADAWLGHVAAASYLMEHAVRSVEYGAVLSVLDRMSQPGL